MPSNPACMQLGYFSPQVLSCSYFSQSLSFLVKGNCQFKDISKIYIKNKKPHLLQGFIMLATNIFMFLIRYFIDLRLTIETRCPKNTFLFATKKVIVISNNTSVMC